MHSFRLDRDLMKRAKDKADKLGISLSALVSLALADKINNTDCLQEDRANIAKQLELLRKHFEQTKK